MPNPRIALLCNNKMAMPALQQMAADGLLAAVATADKDPEVALMYGQAATQYGVPYRKIGAGQVASQLMAWLQEVQPDMVLVMTFPWRIAPEALAVPPMGFINFHYGLLPQMRGADPIFESIRQRLPEVGVTVHQMDEGFDTGAIIAREAMPLDAGLTYGMVSGRLAMMAAKMCAALCKDLASGALPAAMPQDEQLARYWPRIGEQELTINWAGMDSGQIMALVRACNPVARGVPTSINGWKIGVCDVTEINLQGDASNIAPGTIVVCDMQNGLVVYCKDGRGLRLDVVYTAEGILPGYKLLFFGIGQGMVFGG
jgi:methionyl-tRNA formyltransferase